MESFDIFKYLEIALRRKYWIVIPFMIVTLGGLANILMAPKIFEAQTLILVQPQKVPEDYIRAIVSGGTEDRLRNIHKEVTSRTNLEALIKEFELYNDASDGDLLMEEKVELFRKNVFIDTPSSSARGGNSFTIRFQGKDPKKVMEVTNKLASNFISENLKDRESQAMGTVRFFADELDEVLRDLQSKEEQLKNYKEKYRGGLPEELSSNHAKLQRLQGQLEQLNRNLVSAEDRRILIQQGLTSAANGVNVSPGLLLSNQGEAGDELTALKKELSLLMARYKEKHPDVIALKNRIASIEQGSIPSPEETDGTQINDNPADQEETTAVQSLEIQLKNIDRDITRTKKDIKEVEEQIKYYEAKVAETPKRELDLLSINRDYNNLNSVYNSVLDRKLEAEMSVSMEKKQKGEQFKPIDFAQIPHKAIKPDEKKLALITIALGLGLGCGVAFLLEFLDTSYRNPDDLEKDLDLQVITSLPLLFTKKEIVSRKRRRIITAIVMAVCYFSAIGTVIVSIKGLDETTRFLRELL